MEQICEESSKALRKSFQSKTDTKLIAEYTKTYETKLFSILRASKIVVSLGNKCILLLGLST